MMRCLNNIASSAGWRPVKPPGATTRPLQPTTTETPTMLHVGFAETDITPKLAIQKVDAPASHWRVWFAMT